MFISFNMFILLIVATILMIFLIIYLTVTGNDKNNKKKQKKETKRTTPTLNKNNCPPSQKPNVVTDVAKRTSRKSKPYNEHSNQPLERTRLLNLHEANVINENGP